MIRFISVGVLCVAACAPVYAETFVIEADKAGHEATVKIPAGAVTQLSAKSAESLVGYGDAQTEAMRLSGDVLINIVGSAQPIQIKADKIILELTADTAEGQAKPGRSEAAANKVSRSTVDAAGRENPQVFVGNVVFNLQTASGPMEIKADKIEHQLSTEAGV